MKKFFNFVLRFIGYSLIAVILLYLGSNFHVSNQASYDLLKDMSVIKMLNQSFKVDLPSLPRITQKDRLNAIDAVVNAVGMFVMVLGFVPLFIIGSIACLVFGLILGQWMIFLGGIVIIILSPIFFVAIVVGGWLGLLIQPCTPAYAVLWFILGLPAIVAGLAPNKLIFENVTVIFSK